MSRDEHDGDPRAEQGDEDLQRARRALLKAALYVPPAIIGTLVIPRDAQAAPAPSCNPQTCNPAPCNPWRCNPAYCTPDQCAPNACNPDQCGPVKCNPGRPQGCNPGR